MADAPSRRDTRVRDLERLYRGALEQRDAERSAHMNTTAMLGRAESARDAERSARVRAEARRDELEAQLIAAGPVLRNAMRERDAALVSLEDMRTDLDAARRLLRECRPHVERSPFRGTRDALLARIDAIAPADGHKTSESGNDSATPAPGQGTAPSRPADAPPEPGTILATAPAAGERWGVWCSRGHGRPHWMRTDDCSARWEGTRAEADREVDQRQGMGWTYEARPLSPIPRTGGE